MPHKPPQGIVCCDRIMLFEARWTCDTSSNNLIIVEEYSVIDVTARQLRAFLLVAQHGNFPRAAEALFIAPSGWSVSIRQLQHHLGVGWFDRPTRHVAQKSHGSELLAVAQRNLEQLDAALSRIGRSATEASESLSLGATPLVAANILPQSIKEFRGHRPGLRIQLFDESYAEIMKMIEAGKLDIGLGVFFEPASGIRRTPLFRFSLMVIRADNNPAIHRASTTWSALKGETLIAVVPTSRLQQLVDKHLARAGVVHHPDFALNGLDTQIAMVEAGQGIAIIPSYSLPACRSRKVVMSRSINPVVNLDFYQISNRGRKLPPGADDFTSVLQRCKVQWRGRAGGL